jgi:HD-like signal output (HDOD) protein
MDFLPAAANRCFTTEKIWSHAYDTNRIQHYIQTNFLHQKVSHEVATAGLLHKIGIVLMIKFYGQEYINLIRAVFSSEDLDLDILEKEKYGFTHPQISAYFLKSWNAPEPIIEAAAHYYDPTNDAVKNKEIVSIVHIAQFYAAKAQGLNGFAPLMPEAFDIIHLDQSVFESEFDSLMKKRN